MEKPSHTYRRFANNARASAGRWLQLLEKHPSGTDEMRMCVARNHRRAMADARKYDKLAREYQERGR